MNKHTEEDCQVPFCSECLASIKRVVDIGRRNLAKVNDVVATNKEANTEPVKSATPTPLTTNEELDNFLLNFLREFEDKKQNAFRLLEQGKIPRPAKAVEAEHIKLAKTKLQALLHQQTKEAHRKGQIRMLTDVDHKYIKAIRMRNDDRSMSYIAKKLGYKHASGVDWLLKEYPRAELLKELI